MVRKGENAGYQHFLFFPTIISKRPLKDFQDSELCGKGLTLCHSIPAFIDPEKNILKTLWEKDKMLETGIETFGENQKMVISIFSFFRNVFYSLPPQKKRKKRNSHFEIHLFCRLQILSVWTSLKFCCKVKNQTPFSTLFRIHLD